MWLNSVIIFTIILSVSAEDLSLKLCMRNETYDLRIQINQKKEIVCQATSTLNNLENRDDYVHTPGIGSHKLHKDAKTWNEARNICKQENGHLAIINSKDEETAMINILKKETNTIINGINKEQAHIGIHDYFNEGEWITIFDEPLASTGYAHWSTSWWGPQPDNYQTQNCGALVIHGGMDDVKCDDKLAFFCELPLSCERT